MLGYNVCEAVTDKLRWYEKKKHDLCHLQLVHQGRHMLLSLFQTNYLQERWSTYKDCLMSFGSMTIKEMVTGQSSFKQKGLHPF